MRFSGRASAALPPTLPASSIPRSRTLWVCERPGGRDAVFRSGVGGFAADASSLEHPALAEALGL